jgi:hypothetical protein
VAVFIYKTPHAAPLFPSAIPSKTLTVVFIGKFRPPENFSYRVQSPGIAVSPTLFAHNVNESAFVRAKIDTVKSPKKSFPSAISANRCEGAKRSPNFRYRQFPLTRKIAVKTSWTTGAPADGAVRYVIRLRPGGHLVTPTP